MILSSDEVALVLLNVSDLVSFCTLTCIARIIAWTCERAACSVWASLLRLMSKSRGRAAICISLSIVSCVAIPETSPVVAVIPAMRSVPSVTRQLRREARLPVQLVSIGRRVEDPPLFSSVRRHGGLY